MTRKFPEKKSIATALVFIVCISHFVISASGIEFGDLFSAARPAVISNPPELNSDPHEICYLLDRSLITQVTKGRKYSRPWFAEGASKNYPGDGKPEQEFDCKIRNNLEGSERDDEITFNFHSYKDEKSLLSGESIPGKKLNEADLVYDYGPLPPEWGRGGFRAPLALEIFRSCPSGVHYRVYSAITVWETKETPKVLDSEFKEFVEDGFRKIDKMPFCSEKEPWYRR